MIAFGPIPSRRLGQSLGVNNIPPKHCSFDCIYCQVGSTTQTELHRRVFFEPDEIFQAVRQKVQEVEASNHRIDYLTFVPDGEPTLDIQLGRAIELLKTLNIKVGVITNASLLWRKDVRQDLALADLVSLKIDTVDEDAWRALNRLDAELTLPGILDGALSFSKEFDGTLITETMLVRGFNDDESPLTATAEFLGQLNPSTAYIAIPTRPPAESWAQKPDENTLNLACQIMDKHVNSTEILMGFSDDAYSMTGDVVQGLLAITAVHPMRESQAVAYLEKGDMRKSKLDELVAQQELVRVIHEDQAFYVRKLTG